MLLQVVLGGITSFIKYRLFPVPLVPRRFSTLWRSTHDLGTSMPLRSPALGWKPCGPIFMCLLSCISPSLPVPRNTVMTGTKVMILHTLEKVQYKFVLLSG